MKPNSEFFCVSPERFKRNLKPFGFQRERFKLNLKFFRILERRLKRNLKLLLIFKEEERVKLKPDSSGFFNLFIIYKYSCYDLWLVLTISQHFSTISNILFSICHHEFPFVISFSLTPFVFLSSWVKLPSFANRKSFGVGFSSSLKPEGFRVRFKTLFETWKGFGFGLNPSFEIRKGLEFGLNPLSETRNPKGFGFG